MGQCHKRGQRRVSHPNAQYMLRQLPLPRGLCIELHGNHRVRDSQLGHGKIVLPGILPGPVLERGGVPVSVPPVRFGSVVFGAVTSDIGLLILVLGC